MAVVQYTFKHKLYIEKHNQKLCLEGFTTLVEGLTTLVGRLRTLVGRLTNLVGRINNFGWKEDFENSSPFVKTGCFFYRGRKRTPLEYSVRFTLHLPIYFL